MDDAIFQARQELFKELNVPTSRATVRILAWRQRIKLWVWEGMLKSLLFRGGSGVAFTSFPGCGRDDRP